MVDLASLIHYIALFSAHICSCTLDRVEPELEEPTEQAQAENLSNLVLYQGNSQCI
jgi:hypothetical protein